MVEVELRCECREDALSEIVGAYPRWVLALSLFCEALSFLLLREKKDLPPLDWREDLSLENMVAGSRRP
jgi:hypothetical protein